MSNNDRLRVGMIGVGGFGGARRNWIRETNLFEIAAAYDLNPDALRNAQEKDGAQPVESYDALLTDDSLEAIIISTGAKFHAEQVVAALERGRHVFVEKPLCSTTGEIRQIAEAQMRTGLIVGMGHHEHYGEVSSATMKKMVDAGELGTIVSIHATTCHSGGMVIKPGDWRGDADKNPGGMLFQCGVHKFHEMMFYFGPIVEVTSMMRYDANPNTKTADVATCLLRFENGIIGTLNAYHITPYRHFFHIYGTEKNLYRDELGREGIRLYQQRIAPNNDGSNEKIEPIELPGKDDLTTGLRNFYEAVRKGGEPYPSWRDGARAVAVVFAAEESTRSGRCVKVEQF